MSVFSCGDIVLVNLNPTMGNEMQGEKRPCIVLSDKEFNKLGITMIAPITQGGNYARIGGFCVSLMGTGAETQGVIAVSHTRSIDLKARGGRKVEKAPDFVINEAMAILAAIIERK